MAMSIIEWSLAIICGVGAITTIIFVILFIKAWFNI